MERIRIDDDVTVGEQPGVLDLHEIADEGFGAVMNLRVRGEKDQTLAPRAEEEVVRREGLEYRHIPVSRDRLDEDVVDQFRRELDEVPKPVFVHCGAGRRAAALVMMCRAVREGLSGDEAIEMAEELGVRCDDEILNDFVRAFVDDRVGNLRRTAVSE